MKKIILFLVILFISIGIVSESIEETYRKKDQELNAGNPEVIQVISSKSEEEVYEVEQEVVVAVEEPREWRVIRDFAHEVDPEHQVDLKYDGKLPEDLSYVIVLSARVNLRERPTTESDIMSKAYQGKRLKVLELVENNDGQEWYRIEDEGEELFVYKKIVALREFRFARMKEKIEELENFIEENLSLGRVVASVNAYIPNPDNEDLRRNTDKYGNVKDQTATGYYGETKVYVSDRTIVGIEEKIGKRYRIIKQGGEEPYLDVSVRRVDKRLKIEGMPRKVIVIDVKNQNLGVYEKNGNSWSLISYTYSKTGIESRLGFKTPRGSFIVPTAKNFMIYNDAYGEKQGYAEHAIRFSGGGYIHGTPFNLTEVDELEKYRRIKESTLGSYPGTRKCVRNTLEHAKFLFDWVVGGEIREGNVQGIKENVVVIVM